MMHKKNLVVYHGMRGHKLMFSTAARTIIGAFLVLPGLTCALAASAEYRCGWLENPTPANWWLRDAEGLWILSAQGSAPVTGMDLIPDISAHDFVKTNGPYGYACACLNAQFDAAQKRASRIISVRQLPLDKCRQDTKLPKPGD
jgi:hypothetical protein